ncbi:hypothetical protein PR048_008681 [Dryococelus australis]|uniref:Uncharacterized protein n=1 Tax=Dryococelus australis TaxID=614101 RepID=A0ABQ9HXS8_9NEOP|nr:hypothetical protein PR048_008681 [Dryococelus australis]
MVEGMQYKRATVGAGAGIWLEVERKGVGSGCAPKNPNFNVRVTPPGIEPCSTRGGGGIDSLTTIPSGQTARLLPMQTWVRFPMGSLLYFCVWESSRTMELVSGFSRDLPFPLPLHSGVAPYTPRFTLTGSQDLHVHSHPNLFNPISNNSSPLPLPIPRSETMFRNAAISQGQDLAEFKFSPPSLTRPCLARDSNPGLQHPRSVAHQPAAPREVGTLRKHAHLRSNGSKRDPRIIVEVFFLAKEEMEQSPRERAVALICIRRRVDCRRPWVKCGSRRQNYIRVAGGSVLRTRSSEYSQGFLLRAIPAISTGRRQRPTRSHLEAVVLMVSLPAFHQDEPGSIPDGDANGFRTWESCRTMPLLGVFFSWIFSLPRPCIPALLHARLTSPSSALKTSTSSPADLWRSLKPPKTNEMRTGTEGRSSTPSSAGLRTRVNGIAGAASPPPPSFTTLVMMRPSPRHNLRSTRRPCSNRPPAISPLEGLLTPDDSLHLIVTSTTTETVKTLNTRRLDDVPKILPLHSLERMEVDPCPEIIAIEYLYLDFFRLRTGFDSRWGCSRIFTYGNRASRWRWSVGFLGDIPFSPSLSSQRFSILTSLYPHRLSRPDLFSYSVTAIKSPSSLIDKARMIHRRP